MGNLDGRLRAQGVPWREVGHMRSELLLDRERNQIIINGQAIDLSVLYAIVKADHRVLWHFKREKGRVIAVPYSEHEVIWLDESKARPDICIARKQKLK